MTTSDLDVQVTQLSQRLSEVRKQRARADAELDAAKAARDNVVSALANDFGVKTAEEAKAKLNQLEAELAHEIRGLHTALDDMEGNG